MSGRMLLPILVVLLGAALGYRQPLLAWVSLLGLAVAGLAALWSRWGLARLRYSRRLHPTRVFAGAPVQLEVRIENDKLLPLPWLVIEDEVPAAARWDRGRLVAHPAPGRAALLQVVTLGWFERLTRRYTLQLPRRGLYRLGPVTATVEDPFGLHQQQAGLPDTELIAVYPALAPVAHLPLPARRPGSDRVLAGALSEDATRFCGVRPYQPGDDRRRVHWGATARLGSLQVKQFEPAVDAGTCIILDVRTQDAPWEGPDGPLLELMISYAASVFAHAVEAGSPTGLFGNGQVTDQGPGPALAPAQDPGALRRALETLARLKSVAVQPVEDVICRLTGRLNPGTALVLITCRQGPRLWPVLQGCRRKGFAVQVLWAGPAPLPAAPPGVTVIDLAPPEGAVAVHGA